MILLNDLMGMVKWDNVHESRDYGKGDESGNISRNIAWSLMEREESTGPENNHVISGCRLLKNLNLSHKNNKIIWQNKIQ